MRIPTAVWKDSAVSRENVSEILRRVGSGVPDGLAIFMVAFPALPRRAFPCRRFATALGKTKSPSLSREALWDEGAALLDYFGCCC